MKTKISCWKKIFGTINWRQSFLSNLTSKMVALGKVQKSFKKINYINRAVVIEISLNTQNLLIAWSYRCSNFRDIKIKTFWTQLWLCWELCLVKEEIWSKISSKCSFVEKVISIKFTWHWSSWEINSTSFKTIQYWSLMVM